MPTTDSVGAFKIGNGSGQPQRANPAPRRYTARLRRQRKEFASAVIRRRDLLQTASIHTRVQGHVVRKVHLRRTLDLHLPSPRNAACNLGGSFWRRRTRKFSRGH